MRNFILLLPALMVVACTQTARAPQTSLSQSSQSIVLPATYAVSGNSAPRMKTSSDCGENVDHMLTQLEDLMVQSGHMNSDQVSQQ